MTRIISSDDMANVRHSLAEAGIYFDKLYINQAYFNSNFTIQTSNNKPKKSHTSFWHKLLCGKDKNQSSTASTQTALTVRDDSESIPPAVNRRQRMVPTENIYDRRRYRPINREYIHNSNQQSMRRRRSSFISRAAQIQRQKQMNDESEYAV
ncbi:unnamed protein product [Adineta steineri]|uniref:Uncharacterized protein n=1 Tax=Adineta steineri TaxID=433720 RepID=A0A815DC96_9BILA|nr:unnamed protein product [Adineta steineri]CAF3692580.1 unnamed protein product [Adineta steineri]